MPIVEAININEVIEKVESHYKNLMSEEDFKKACEEVSYALDMVLSHEHEQLKSFSIPEAVAYCITDNTTQQFHHLIILAGLKLEKEKQKKEANDSDWRAMCELLITHFKQFIFPDGDGDITVISPSEFFSLLEEEAKLKKKRNKLLIEVFLTSFFVYTPLALPFLILKWGWLIILAIKYAIPAAKKYVNAGQQLDVVGILKGIDKDLPKIMHFEYWYHHLILGILMWVGIIKILF